MNNNEKQVPFDAMMTTIPWSYKHGGLCQANRSVAVELSIISVALHTVDVIDCLSVRLVSLFDSLTRTCFDELPRLLDLLTSRWPFYIFLNLLLACTDIRLWQLRTLSVLHLITVKLS